MRTHSAWHASEQKRQPVFSRDVVALQQFPVSVRKRCDVEQIANVGSDARDRVGNRDAHSRTRRVQRAHRCEVFGERARMKATEVVLADNRCVRRRVVQREMRDVRGNDISWEFGRKRDLGINM